MKILIAGAHFTTAQAVIEKIREQNYPVVYVGRKHTREGDNTASIESQVLPKLGVKFISLTTGRVRRTLDFQTIFSFIKIPIGFIQAFYIVARENPDIVVSFGGYIGLPVVFAAWLLSKPIIIHEQTLVSGLSNLISSYFADEVAVSFDKKYSFSEKKLVLTGNPLRANILNVPSPSLEVEKIFKIAKAQKLPIIFVTGGNQGSHFINKLIGDNLEYLLNKACLIHQTGDSSLKDFEVLMEKKQQLKNTERYFVAKWMGDDFGPVAKNADLVVSRAGANTLLELAYFGTPTLMIPLPIVLKNEQLKNAHFFEELGLGEVATQSSLNSQRFIELINKMLRQRDQFKEKAKAAKALVLPDAADRLVHEILLWGLN